ncbi:MAG: hypothetical protein H0V82_01240 [Candidatus Protochlamydia sp.]|nr:hypothetical protein [Candidatus Protochlamydia sp.]
MSKILSSRLEYREEKSFWTIACCVIVLHFIGLWTGTYWTTEPPKKNTAQRVVVSTVALNPQFHSSGQPQPPATPPGQQIEKTISLPLKEEAPLTPPSKVVQEEVLKKPASAPTKPIEKKPEAKPIPPSPPKAIAPKPVPEKKEIPKTVVKSASPPAAPKKNEEEIKRREKDALAAKEAEKVHQQEIAAIQEASRKKEQALLAKAKENLAKIAETRNSINTTPSLKLDEAQTLKPISHLSIDALPGEYGGGTELSSSEINYRNEVAGRLKSGLRLPDYGAVKIKLTLDRSGKVTQIEVVSSESQKNKAYIEKTLPSILFANFGIHFKGATHYTFLVSLNNE